MSKMKKRAEIPYFQDKMIELSYNPMVSFTMSSNFQNTAASGTTELFVYNNHQFVLIRYPSVNRYFLCYETIDGIIHRIPVRYDY